MEIIGLAAIILGISALISKKRNSNSTKGEQDRQECSEGDPTRTLPYFTRKYISRNKKETTFINPQKGIRKKLVDNLGNIADFPGFENPDELLGLLERNTLPLRVEFCTSFEEQADGTHMMLWEVQPDGRYWEDESGFGGTSDVEITLYSFIDEYGDFTSPFRIHHVGREEYYQKS